MRIMYISHINWYWIFQRPQILALLLEKDFDVTVYSKQVLFKPRVSKNNKRPKKLKNIVQLPKENCAEILKRINRFLYAKNMNNIYKYDAVWICHPNQYEFIPDQYQGIVIYDCMDNYISLARKEDRKKVKNNEQALLNRADIIFVSSNYLQSYILKDKQVYLVRNGYNYSKAISPVTSNFKDFYTLGYIGTIAKWFDFDLVKNSVKSIHNIEYKLIGPNETSFNGDDRISLEGVVQYNELGRYIKDYDALIMPFVINDVILAVDPVKLYEYISFGKCIISVWYPEVDRFLPYVYFYRNENEYHSLLRELVENGFPPKYNQEQQIEFLKDNTWDEHYEHIKNILLGFKKDDKN